MYNFYLQKMMITELILPDEQKLKKPRIKKDNQISLPETITAIQKPS